MARFSAVLDARVLVLITQADTLLHLAEADLYRPRWTTLILEEVVGALERIHPDMKQSAAARHRANVMNAVFDDAPVRYWTGSISRCSTRMSSS